MYLHLAILHLLHSGVPVNEKADELAKHGANIVPTGPEPIVGAPYFKIEVNISIHRAAKFDSYWLN